MLKPITNKEARAQAQKLGYREVSDPPMKTKSITFVNSKGNHWITPDLNGHKGGCWKGYDRAGNRTTWNFDLTEIVGK